MKVEAMPRSGGLRVLQPFARLEAEKMRILQSRLRERLCIPGENITLQGDQAGSYYIVKTGRVAVLKRNRDGTGEEQMAVLGEGEGFGEEALIRNEPRNATCRAMQVTVVYVLSKTDFAQILQASFLETIFSEEIPLEGYQQRYVLIDARVPAEYEREHISGAVNIPLEGLRRKLPILDPQRDYITYCTNDGRGMVAAYLLKNHGFKAKCLRGGISAWLGPTTSGYGR